MELDRRRHPQGGNELPPIDQTLDFIRGFAYGNPALETLMREYVFETRTTYIDKKLEDEAADKIGIILVGIGFSLISGDIAAYSQGRRRYAAEDRFRNYMILGKRTGNQEMDEMFNAVGFMVLIGNETMEDRIATLEKIWEARHPGQVFAPDIEE